MARSNKLRDSSFCESWWKLEEIVRGRKKDREYAKIPHEGPNGESMEKVRGNGKGEETRLDQIEKTTEKIVASEKPPC